VAGHMGFSIGETVGPYRITQQLGLGGMATVYSAYHANLDRYVAIKVLHAALKADSAFEERFRREAQIVAKLEHPNIVPVYDYSQYEGEPYLVMKFIEGETLKARIGGEALSLAETLRLINAVSAALTYAHERDILHRDIKPSNILIETRTGEPYIADFGLARIASMGESTLSKDMLLGTPQYLSPEQASGGALAPATDIYSLGVVVYEMVCGRVPFTADTPYAIIHNHIYAPLPMPRQMNPTIPAAVERVLLKVLAKDPADRYPTAVAFAQAFTTAVRESGLRDFATKDVRPPRPSASGMNDFKITAPSVAKSAAERTPSPIPNPIGAESKAARSSAVPAAEGKSTALNAPTGYVKPTPRQRGGMALLWGGVLVAFAVVVALIVVIATRPHPLSVANAATTPAVNPLLVTNLAATGAANQTAAARALTPTDVPPTFLFWHTPTPDEEATRIAALPPTWTPTYTVTPRPTRPTNTPRPTSTPRPAAATPPPPSAPPPSPPPSPSGGGQPGQPPPVEQLYNGADIAEITAFIAQNPGNVHGYMALALRQSVSGTTAEVEANALKAVEMAGKELFLLRDMLTFTEQFNARTPTSFSKAAIGILNGLLYAYTPLREAVVRNSASLAMFTFAKSATVANGYAKVLVDLAQKTDSDPYLMMLSAMALLKTNNTTDGLAAMTHAASGRRLAAETHLVHGIILKALGQKDKAKAAFEEANGRLAPTWVRDEVLRQLEGM